MQKILTLFFLFCCFFLHAAPNGNPSYPAIIEEGFFIPDTSWINFRLGYQVYDSSNLHMEFGDDQKNSGFVLRKIKAYSNAGNFTLNIKERLDLYIEIASYYLEPEFRNGSILYKAKSEKDLLYRGGVKLALFEIRDFTLGVDVNYSIFFASSSFLTQNDTSVDEGNLKYELKEWQIGVGLAQKISFLRPYIGVAYKDTDIKLKNAPFLQNQTADLSFQKKTGMFLGSSASMGSFFLFNIELRFVNEKSVTYSAQIRF